MTGRATIAFLATLGTTSLAAQSDPVAQCLSDLDVGLANITARAGEVEAERGALQDVLRGLRNREDDLYSDREALRSIEASLRLHDAEIQSESARISREQQTLFQESLDLVHRVNSHNADVRVYEAECLPVVATEAEKQRCDQWWATIGARAEALNREGDQGDDRQRQLDLRQDVLERKQHDDDARQSERERLVEQIEEATAGILTACNDAHSRMLAVAAIADAPARDTGYDRPDALASKVLVGMAQEGALVVLARMESRTAIRQVVQRLGPRALGVSPIGLAYNVWDIAVEAETAGVDQRTREVEQNLLLIGDYAAAMRVLATRGPSDPTYLAVRRELTRLQQEMPTSGAQVLQEGLWSAAALADAFRSVASKYVAGHVGKWAGGRLNRLNNAQRVRWRDFGERYFFGMGGIKVGRPAITAAASGSSEELLKRTGREIDDLLRSTEGRDEWR